MSKGCTFFCGEKVPNAEVSKATGMVLSQKNKRYEFLFLSIPLVVYLVKPDVKVLSLR